MLSYFRSIRDAAKDRGASAVEYGLMVAAIAAVIVAVVFALGNFIGSAFDETCDEINASVQNTRAGGDQCP